MFHITKPGGPLWKFRPQVFLTLFLHYLVNLGSSSFSVLWQRLSSRRNWIWSVFCGGIPALCNVSIGHIHLLLTEWKLLNRVFRETGGRLYPRMKHRLMPTPHPLQGHNLTDMIWYQFWVRILNFLVISMTMKSFEIIAWPGVDHKKLFSF